MGICKKVNNYLELKAVIIEVIRYLDCEAPYKENANYDKKDIRKVLNETVKDAIQEYYEKK